MLQVSFLEHLQPREFEDPAGDCWAREQHLTFRRCVIQRVQRLAKFTADNKHTLTVRGKNYQDL